MFKDKFGLTQAVLEGRKTMTRRIACYGEFSEPCVGFEDDNKCYLYNGMVKEAVSQYYIGETVAIAQSYKVAKVTYRSYLIATDNKGKGYVKGFLNKMYVRPDLMPHHIRITNIRVERLQDISDEDCLKEGIRRKKFGDSMHYYFERNKGFYSAKDAFSILIDKVSGKGTWNSNPYVFVYEFELIN